MAWRMGGKAKLEETAALADEFLDAVDPTINVVDPVACEHPEDEAPSFGYIQGAFYVLKSIVLYLWTILQAICVHIWTGLKYVGTHTWNWLTTLWRIVSTYVRDKWNSIDFDDLRARAEKHLEWLRAKLEEWYWQAHKFVLERHDIWIHHPSTNWLEKKTGYDAETIVLAQASFVGLVLLGLFYRFVWKRKSRRRKKRGADRSLSMTFGNPEATRGARDRGFSLDLSVTQSTTSSSNRTRGLGGLVGDFFRKSHPAGDVPQVGGNRDRGNSFDLFRDGPGLGDGVDDPNHAIGIQPGDTTATARPNTAKVLPLVTYYGPTETTLVYNTWTPPPSWTEASRSLMPHDTRIKLQREITLDLAKDQCLMTIREPSNSQTPLTLAVADVSLHVKTPLIGGVLELYVKDSTKDEWMEHTFDVAKNAAQFQIDLLALQLFGPALHRMYQTLELIHQGSMACEGREYVCHHDQMSDEKPQGIGVAWDDAMRALGSNVPSLRVALERLWWTHYQNHSLKLRARKRARKDKNNNNKSSASSVGSAPSSGGTDDQANGGGGGEGSSDAAKKESNVPTKNQNEYIHLTQDYVRRRLLLGPVDFFRLFVPWVPETALPNNESTKKRMVQLLRWRKRAATAAILVQGYVKAKIVVNHGWVLSRPLPTHYLTRRLSFDDNIDNSNRDTAARNEYYEATVSRDVLTFVRPNKPDTFKPRQHWWEYLRPRKLRNSISRYQAYSLVGSHVFKIPQDDAFPLNPKNDPVLTFGSLRQLVEAHPDMDFMIFAFFPSYAEVCYVNVCVRSLPRGVDAAFDRNMSRFKHGSEEIRDKKLHMMLQLGSSEIKTWAEVAASGGMTYLMRSLAGDLDSSTPNADLGPSDRTPFPLVPISRFGQTHHFGGALQKNRNQPQNYCAATVNMDPSKAGFNLLARLFMSLIERGFMAKNVYDVTWVLAANEQDELPERALSTVRFVRLSAKDIALPSIFVYGSKRADFRRRSTWDANNFKSVMGNVSNIGDRLRAMAMIDDSDEDETTNYNSLRGSTDSQRQRKQLRAEAFLNSRKLSTVTTQDPIEKAVNELVEILCDVKIPVRRDQLPLYDFAAAVPMSLLEAHSTNDGSLHDKELLNMSLLLLITRGDIQRHYIAAGCNLKKAAIRIVETAAWRGQTFPIDQRICRIELQSGQFFQQGTDLMGRPVFYFRNMGLGPWRKDNDASVAAVLNRLEGALWEFSQHDDNVTCTLIVIMGKPYREYLRRKGSSDAASTAGEEEEDDDDMEASMASASFKDCGEDSPDGRRVANPRVNPDETWQLHTNKKLLKQMVTLVSAHYPERLHQALVVLKPQQTISVRKIMGSWRLNNLVESPVTRSKVKFLNTFNELQNYISKQELVTIAGGETPVNPEVFGLPD